MGERHGGLDFGAVDGGADRKLPVDLFDALLHVAQAKPAARARARGVDAAAVVGDAQRAAAGVAAQVDMDAGRAGMALDIGERLLRHAVERDLGLVVEPVAEHHRVEFGGDAGATAEILRERLERGTEAEVVERAGAQVAADAAHLLDGGGEVRGTAVERVSGARVARGQPPPRGCERIAHADEDLADAVVQFARDAPALFLLRVEYPLRQPLEFGIGEAALADGDEEPGDENEDQREDRRPADEEERALHARLHLLARGGDGGGHLVDEDARADRPAPVLQADNVGHHLRALAGRWPGPDEAVIAPARARQPYQLVGDGHARGILEPGPVAPDEFGAPGADEVGAVIVEYEEIAVLSVEHRGQDLADLLHG